MLREPSAATPAPAESPIPVTISGGSRGVRSRTSAAWRKVLPAVDPSSDACRTPALPARAAVAGDNVALDVAHAAPLRRITLFVQEPFAAPRTTGVRAGVICDGTTRGGPNGIAEGAARVVACAERCADRGDVDLFVAFVLSPQNLVRRAMPFFTALHAEFLRLLEGVVAGRALVGIRVEVEGRLDRLRSKGGAAARLANTIELLVEATSSIANPRARLALGVDYAEDAPLARDLDVLVRTGMEEANVLRLSGLRVRKETVCIPTATLWRDFGPLDLDRALGMAAKRVHVEPAPGFGADLLAALAAEIGRVDLGAPLRLLVPVAAPAAGTLAEIRSLLRARGAARLQPMESGLGDGPGSWLPRGVVLTVEGGPGAAPRRLGARDAPVEIRLLDRRGAPWPRAGAPVAWIVPGQSPPALHLLERSARDANIHVCEPTPIGIVDGVREALRFHRAHPPLHGAPRPSRGAATSGEERVDALIRFVASRPGRSAEALAAELGGGDGPRDGESLTARTGDLFAAKCLLELGSSGLVSGEVDWARQAFGYALTAFGIAHRPAEKGGADWEPAARDLARAMLVMASSDEEISDRVFDDEAPAERRARLETSVDHLAAALRGEDRPAPDVRCAGVLGAVARGWRGFFERRTPTSHPAILAAARRAAEDLHRATLEELSREEPRGLALSCPVPAAVARRLCDLRRAAEEGPFDRRAAALRELRLLGRLRRVAPSIGAGCAFLVMAATEPADAVPAAGVDALLRVTPLVDHAFRLANDLAFTDATRGDRDDKPNTFTCLVPSGLRGKDRERASAEALRTCRTTMAWLEAEIREASLDLARVWPLAASWLARGMHVGRRAYQNGHYDRLASSAIAAIVREVEEETHVREEA